MGSTVTSVHNEFTMALRSLQLKRSISCLTNMWDRKHNARHNCQNGTALLLLAGVKCDTREITNKIANLVYTLSSIMTHSYYLVQMYQHVLELY